MKTHGGCQMPLNRLALINLPWLEVCFQFWPRGNSVHGSQIGLGVLDTQSSGCIWTISGLSIVVNFRTFFQALNKQTHICQKTKKHSKTAALPLFHDPNQVGNTDEVSLVGGSYLPIDWPCLSPCRVSNPSTQMKQSKLFSRAKCVQHGPSQKSPWIIGWSWLVPPVNGFKSTRCINNLNIKAACPQMANQKHLLF